MNTNKKIALASFAALILPIAMSAPANAITIATTPCVLNIPAKTEVVRGDLTGLYNFYGQFRTLKETDLTCPDVANPFKTTDISYTNSNGGVGGSYWSLTLDGLDDRQYGGGNASFIAESTLGKEYGEKRIEFYVGIGTFKNVSKMFQSFIRTPGADATLNTDDDVLYPMTFSNGIVNKYRSDVSVKAKRSGTNLKVTVTVDRNLTDILDDVTPVYANKSDKVTLYRDGKAIKTVKVGSNGKATFTVKDKKGANNYSVILPANVINHEGSATFVK